MQDIGKYVSFVINHLGQTFDHRASDDLLKRLTKPQREIVAPKWTKLYERTPQRKSKL